MSITNEACLAHLQGMVRIPTVSNPDSRLMDFSKFDELHDFLRTSAFTPASVAAKSGTCRALVPLEGYRPLQRKAFTAHGTSGRGTGRG